VRIADVILEQYDASAWIAPNFLAVGALGILSADYGLGKSTLLSQFGACASSGRDFMGYLVTRPIGCLYWQAEGSRRLFAGRVRDQCRNLGLDLDTLPLHFVPRGMDPLPFDSRDFAEFVTQSGCGLVIFDTFGYFSDGDENSAKDWKQNVAKPLKAIGRATGISFFLVHHEGKPNEFRRGRHKIRGSSAMGGDCDTVLRLERVPDSPNARLLAFDKVKDTEEQPDALLGFNKTTAIFTREGVAESATAVPNEDRAKARQAAKDEDERKAKEGIGLLFRRSPEGLTAEEIRQASGRRREWVATVIDEFHALGYIELGTRERLDSRGRKIRVNVWKWKTAAT
jgi:RecA-family ATPase